MEKKTNIPNIQLSTIVLDTNDMEGLEDFYIRLLGWEKAFSQEGVFSVIRSGKGGVEIAFQSNEDYVPPCLAGRAGLTTADGTYGFYGWRKA